MYSNRRRAACEPHAMLFVWCAVAAFCATAGQQQIRDRDLNLEAGAGEKTASAVQVPRGYALVIGIGDYRHLSDEHDLRYAESDAKAVAGALIGKEAGNVEPENLKLLLGPDATLENMRSALEDWLPSIAQEADRVIVYFVGHGLVDGSGRGYLAPYDLDPAQIASSAYPMERLGYVLGSRVKARWKVLLTDACHSGKVTPSTTDESVNQAFAKLPKNFLTLTSSREAERSYEDADLAGGFGVYSYFLVKGWEGQADTEPLDGIVTADELITYVRREVRSYARQRGFSQTPTERGDFENDLILGFSPGRRGGVRGAAGELANGALTVEVNLDGVEIYIDDRRMGVADRARSLKIPGLASGVHVIKATRLGYEPATREVVVYPGSDNTVSLRILHPRNIKPEAKALFERGARIWTESGGNESELRRAAALLIAAVNEQPDYSEASLALCRVRQQQRRTEEAVQACRKAVLIDPDFVEARTMFGALLNEIGDHAEAVRQLSIAAQQNDRDPYVHSLLAEALFWHDRYPKAEEEADRAVQLSEAHAQGYLFRAEARRLQRKCDAAASDYRKYLEVEKFESGVLRKAAFYFIGHGTKKHHAGRRKLYESQRFSAYFGLCACELDSGNLLRAAGYCGRALEIDRYDADTRVLLGEAYVRLFNRDNRRDYLTLAKQQFELALRLNPDLDKAPQIRTQLRQVNEYLPLVR